MHAVDLISNATRSPAASAVAGRPPRLGLLAPDDLSAVAWVLTELKRSLEAANKTLRRYLRDAEAARHSDLDAVEPSVLRSAVCEWFEQDDDVPFMMQVYQIRSEKRVLIPAVTHVDGSGLHGWSP